MTPLVVGLGGLELLIPLLILAAIIYGIYALVKALTKPKGQPR